jgi:photosystem II stability/assembly factor-like uncharacterized protein
MRNVDAKGILMDSSAIYVASGNTVYKAKDSGAKWEGIFYAPSGAGEITCIGGNSKNIFVGTRRGLFRSQDHGAVWKNVFRTVLPDKNDIRCVEVSRHAPFTVIIGTGKGVFSSDDMGARWRDITENLADRAIRHIAINRQCVYLAGDSGIYMKRMGEDGWTRIIVKSAGDRPETEEAEETAEGGEEYGVTASCIAVRDKRVYAGIDKRILYSDDEGKSWQAISASGLAGLVNHILPEDEDGRLYCATTKGVFEFIKDKAAWSEIYSGFDKSPDVRMVMRDAADGKSLWAATDRGIYKMDAGSYASGRYNDIERSLKALKVSIESEPPFKDLQRAAIRFAEVSPDKIKAWRDQARMRAILPKVSFGWDNDSSTTSEIYTSATKDYIVTGPDDISSGWNVSFSWELGDLIWSDDQTNIDVRSRLTTQLRNDILDDLRRAYYERKRIQFEMMTSPPKDAKSCLDKEMRLQEMTQTIDDLTGNYFSDYMRNVKRKD